MMQQDTSDVENRANQDVTENATEYATVIYYYMAKEDDELSLKVGDIVEVVSKDKAESGDDGGGMVENLVKQSAKYSLLTMLFLKHRTKV